MASKIIITGGTGFVGRSLTFFTKKKSLGEVYNLSLRAPFNELPNGKVIIHLAGKAHDLKKTANPQEYFDVNYKKTKELFDLFLESNIKDFIYFSSVKAVADVVDDILYEDVSPNPKTPYGKSKYQAEEYLLNKKLPEGRRLFILRPCMIHGPGNKGNLNLLYSFVRKGIPYPLGSYNNRRSFLSIDNLLFILERIINDPTVPGAVYNISDDEPVSTIEVIKIIGIASGSNAHIWNVPPSLINFFARLGDKLKLPLNTERLAKLTENYVVSNKKLMNVLKIDQLPISSTDGLMKTIRSFRST